MSEISFRRWYLQGIWKDLKDLWFFWSAILATIIIFVLSGFFFPDLLETDSFMEKGSLGTLIFMLGLFGIIGFFKYIVLPVIEYRKSLYEKYEREILNKKRGV